MPFPDAEHAIVAEEKVRDYLLNFKHPIGGPKARWFVTLGYTIDNWQDLVNDLRWLVETADDFVAKPSPFGVKYEVRGELGRPGYRLATVLTVWIVDGNAAPRLITAYPG